MTNEELSVIITAKIDDLQKNLNEANKEIENLSKKGSKSIEGLKKVMGGIGKATGAAMKTMAAGVAAGAAAMIGLAESTQDYRKEQAKLTAAFASAGLSAESAKSTYNDLYAIIGESDVAVEAAQQIALFSDNTEHAAQMASLASGIVGTFGDALTPETFYEAANETLSLGEATGAYTQMLEQSHMSVDEFNAKLAACNTEAEKQALIIATAEQAMGKAGAAYEGAAGSIIDANRAQATLTDGLAQLGAAAEPIVTVFKQLAGDTLQKLAPSFQLVSEGLMDVINGVDGGAAKMEKGISDMITTVIDTIVAMLPTLITVGVSLIVSLVKGITKALPNIVNAIVKAIPMLIDGLLEAVQTIIAALPTIIQTLVDALPVLIPQLITGIINLIVMLCESIGAILQPIIDALPGIIISIVDAIMSNLPALISGIISLVMAVVKAIPQIIQGLVDALPTIISSIIDGLLSALPQIIAGLIQVVWGIVKSLPQIFMSLIEGIINIFAGIWDGLGKVFGKLGSWFGEKFGGAVTAIKNAFASVGDFFIDIWNKIKGAFAAVKTWFKDIFTGAWNAVKNVFSGVGSFFSGIWDKIKSVFTNIGQKIGDAVSGAFKKAINFVLGGAIKIINGFISAINLAIKVINYIPGVNIKKLEKLNVPQLAKGGIVDSATLAVVGEAGTEAVVPLENNLGWLDKLSGMLAERLSVVNNSLSQQPIYLMVDKKVLAETTAEGINDITRQTGYMPLVIA